jgi:hypothetical protein
VGFLPLVYWHIQHIEVLLRHVATLVDETTLASLAMLLHVGRCAM